MCIRDRTSAAAKYAATALFMDILMTAARTLLLPLAYVCLAAVSDTHLDVYKRQEMG